MPTPYNYIVGVWKKIYVASYGVAEPDVDVIPGGDWAQLAGSTGDQELNFDSSYEFFFDNDHQGPVAAVRGDENVMVSFQVGDMTLENMARALSELGNVRAGTTTAGNNIKQLPLKRGFDLTFYALLLKGDLDSPYGLYPGQFYIPLCIQVGNPTVTRSKTSRMTMGFEYRVLEDDNQTSGDEMGWVTVQTS